MKWHDHPRSSTAILASGYVLQINKTATDQWRARAIGMPVDGEFPTREAAKSAAIAEAARRAAAVLLAVGWPDDATISKTLAVWYQDDNWQEALSPYVNKTMDEMHAALTTALMEAAGE